MRSSVSIRYTCKKVYGTVSPIAHKQKMTCAKPSKLILPNHDLTRFVMGHLKKDTANDITLFLSVTVTLYAVGRIHLAVSSAR